MVKKKLTDKLSIKAWALMKQFHIPFRLQPNSPASVALNANFAIRRASLDYAAPNFNRKDAMLTSMELWDMLFSGDVLIVLLNRVIAIDKPRSGRIPNFHDYDWIA